MLNRLWSEMRFRWRALVGRARMESELDEELGFHLEQEQKKLEARGLSPEEARRRARVAFGGFEGAKEASRDARGVRLLEDTWADLRYAVRTLRLQPAFVLGVAGTLALGIGANAAIFGIVDRLMFRQPAGLLGPERVHRVYLQWMQDGELRTDRSMPYPRFRDLARETRTLDLVAGFQVRTVALGEGEETREGRVAVVSAEYLGFFDAAPALGRWFSSADDEPPAGAPVVVLSHAYWLTRYGGRHDVLGQTLQVDRLRATIIGVAPPGFSGISDGGSPLAFVPMSAFAHALRGPSYTSSYNWGWLELLVRRKPGVTAQEATADLSNAFRASWRAEDLARGIPTDIATAQPGVALGPVQLGRGPDARLDARVTLWISGVALVVLLIACANVANLFLSRAVGRRREIAMRLALGVGRGRLTRQLVLESVALGVLGGLGGLVLTWLGGGAWRRMLLPDAADAAVLTDPRTLLYAVALALLAGGLTAIVPAVMASRENVAVVLKSGGRGNSRRRSRLQACLVVAQAALSVVLLVGAALFVRSLQGAERHRLGVDVDSLLYAEVNGRGVRLTESEKRDLVVRMIEVAGALPGVSHAAMASSVPFWSSESRSLFVEGVENVQELGRFTFQAGSGDYFPATGTRILRGRGFTGEDRQDTIPVIVVSEPMARALWPGREALGQCVRVDDAKGPCRSVIGVAEEIAMQSLEPERAFTYYLPVAQFPEALSPQLFLRVSGDPIAVMPTVRSRLQALLPSPAYINVVPMRDLVAPQYRAWRLGATMFVAFGGLALLLAALGLHSLMAYEAARREQEFGVRLALGASRQRILTLVVGHGAALAIAGVGLGTVLALALSWPLEALMFHQSTRDPSVYAAAAFVLVACACLACAIPALRATRLDPVVPLRAD